MDSQGTHNRSNVASRKRMQDRRTRGDELPTASNVGVVASATDMMHAGGGALSSEASSSRSSAPRVRTASPSSSAASTLAQNLGDATYAQFSHVGGSSSEGVVSSSGRVLRYAPTPHSLSASFSSPAASGSAQIGGANLRSHAVHFGSDVDGSDDAVMNYTGPSTRARSSSSSPAASSAAFRMLNTLPFRSLNADGGIISSSSTGTRISVSGTHGSVSNTSPPVVYMVAYICASGSVASISRVGFLGGHGNAGGSSVAAPTSTELLIPTPWTPRNQVHSTPTPAAEHSSLERASCSIIKTFLVLVQIPIARVASVRRSGGAPRSGAAPPSEGCFGRRISDSDGLRPRAVGSPY